MLRQLLISFFLLCVCISVKSQTHSVLSSGEWFKVSTYQDGVYKLSYSDFKSLGINADTVLISDIRIFGNGGGMLPKLNSDFRPIDLKENAIKVIDINQNNLFEEGDYVLFYGQSPNRWKYNSNIPYFNYNQHLYSDKNFYFLTVNSIGNLTGSPKRIEEKASLLYSTAVVSSFNDYKVHEIEQENLIESGIEWYGERFQVQNKYSFQFNFPNIEINTPVDIKTAVCARSLNSSFFKVTADGVQIQQVNVPNVILDYASEYAKNSNQTSSFNTSNSNISIEIEYFSTASNSIGWLNYLELNARRELRMVGSQMHFRDLNSVGENEQVQFVISAAQSTQKIWDVTNPNQARQMQTNLENGNMSYISHADSLREYIIFDSTNFLIPSLDGSVANQNLRGLEGTVSYVIITHPAFLDAAYRLANLHSVKDGLNSIVVTPQQIYNEFSSGAQDVTAIRDFLRMLYRKPSSELKYVLLFGDGSYDPKNRIMNNTNFIPTYQSQNSTHPTLTYVTDDFFALLDDHEGLFINDLIDIGIGRLPVQSVSQANDMVDKIERYYSKESFGDWRNRMTFIADDGDDNDANTHMWQADSLANRVYSRYQNINLDKIYLDHYEQISTTGGPRSPHAQEAINNTIEKGTFLINYTGHGGELGWTSERILEVPQINSWKNTYQMPIFMTATCKFSRFDAPQRISAGEYTLLNNNGGAIALLTTTRLVYSSPNYTLNTKFIDVLFDSENDQKVRLGDVFLKTKILSGTNINNRNFTLLGDPALSLSYPENIVQTKHISVDTMKALSEVTIEGEVKDQNGNLMTEFNGFVFPTVYDKQVTAITLGQESCTPMPYKIQKNIIHKGQSSVNEGLFHFSFVVPKDISYEIGSGRISYYAVSNSSEPVDASGFDTSFIIGGTADNITYDYDEPEINLYINDQSFVSGGITDKNPVLLVYLSDFSGINTVGNGIGHDIVGVLDNQTNTPLILNDFYESNIDDYTRGTIRFPFKNLTSGTHTLRVKAWDVFNNSAEATITFVVKDENTFFVSDFQNQPNPFTDLTQFYFEHNKSNQVLDVNLEIYSITGELVRVISKDIFSSGYRVGPLEWDGKNELGSMLGPGIYIANLNIISENGDFISKSSRVILLPQ